MTVLSSQSIRKLCENTDKPMITEFVSEKRIQNGMSYGLSGASYDCRIAETIRLYPKQSVYSHTVESFHMPDNVVGLPCDKSTYARRFLSSYNTVIDPGWQGNLTIELTNNSDVVIDIQKEDPIIQIVFHWLDEATDRPYGPGDKYYGQTKAAHGPRFEEPR